MAAIVPLGEPHVEAKGVRYLAMAGLDITGGGGLRHGDQPPLLPYSSLLKTLRL